MGVKKENNHKKQETYLEFIAFYPPKYQKF